MVEQVHDDSSSCEFARSHSSHDCGGSSCSSCSTKAERIDTCLFDLDDTLYARSVGIADSCRRNIRDYMVQRLGFDEATVDVENMRLYRKHGTTMAGLRAEGHKFSFDDWHSFVHGRLPYHVLGPDPVLRNILHSLPQSKYVFTNGDRAHAARCLRLLGLEDCFRGVITFEDVMAHPPINPHPLFDQFRNAAQVDRRHSQGLLSAAAGCRDAEVGWEQEQRGEEEQEGGNSGTASAGMAEEDLVQTWRGVSGPLVCCKPQAEAFARALSLAGNARPGRTVMFDDSVANIIGAKQYGLSTVLVGAEEHVRSADYCVSSLHNLRAAVPMLWDGIAHVSGLEGSDGAMVDADGGSSVHGVHVASIATLVRAG